MARFWRRLACAISWAVSASGLALAQDAPSRQVLESFPVEAVPAAHGKPVYELSLASCQSAPCPFEVRLLSRPGKTEPGMVPGGKASAVLDSIALGWPANATEAQSVDAQARPGGWALAPGPAPRVWSTGEEENHVSVSARTLPLEREKPGTSRALWVTQMAGFDHPKRRHAMYVASSVRLKTAWSRSDPQGPHVSRVVVPVHGAPVHLSMFLSPSDDVADKVSAQRLEWDGRRQVFVEKPAAAALHAVVAASYSTLREARAARAASACVAEYGVVDTWPAKGLVPRRYALIALAVEPVQAAAETARLSECQPDAPVRVHPLGRLSPRSFSAR
ncbi:hypothetical protein [Acidovorax sp. SUPP3334]|uniref:hypothetical protein n=1 Tax=Acidovorax sp. SUPP3334 TaxID=2920881 RepID=UPI0023DE2D07|nr:hypothetical protein [Acidovorax sp. SUPP3334]GKT25665.1 hypothetical protein AVHM3334_18670 [Acidovorax sp. SUPP3334]